MRRSGSASLFASPTLVGSITVLVLTIGVFLAYNANNGLPFVPTRVLKVQMASGSELLKGNEVRQGGTRIGLVSDMKPVRLPNGKIGAEATLNLDTKAGSIPTDTVATIRTRSALGLKYLELQRGQSSQVIADGGTLPLSQTVLEVDLDQVYNIFDKRTRDASQGNLGAFGDAFVGRGADINQAIHDLGPTLQTLVPVARNLADPQTALAKLFPALERVTGTVAPLAGIAANTFTSMADTFAAISADPQALKDTITKNPPTLAVGTRSLQVQLPFLRESARFAGYLDAATTQLRRALPSLNSALAVATPVTLRSPELYNNLQPALNSLNDLALAPTTNGALRGLTATVVTLQPQLRFLGPFVTVCNYWNTFWDFISEHFSAPTPQGTGQRALLNFASQQTDSYGTKDAPHPANGEGVTSGPPIFLHAQPYGHAVDNQGRADCVSGQAGQVYKANKYADQKLRIAVDPVPPDGLGYPLGPTFAHFGPGGHGYGLNPSHVPAGETYTALAGGKAAQLP